MKKFVILSVVSLAISFLCVAIVAGIGISGGMGPKQEKVLEQYEKAVTEDNLSLYSRILDPNVPDNEVAFYFSTWNVDVNYILESVEEKPGNADRVTVNCILVMPEEPGSDIEKTQLESINMKKVDGKWYIDSIW